MRRRSFSTENVMSDGAIETYHAGGLWHNRVLGERGVLDSHDLKRDAQWHRRQHATDRFVEHVTAASVAGSKALKLTQEGPRESRPKPATL